MEFLYPRSRQFPFDEVSEQIVRELEKRNWDVPGITVEFHDYGSDEQRFRIVRCIKSQDFKICFHRVQRIIVGPGDCWNDIAAVAEIVIPKKELCVYKDESGPTFYLYVGNDYEKDRERFINTLKVHSRLNNEPRWYLRYDGSTRQEGGYHYLNQRSPYLVHNNDLGREYEPREGEPKVFRTAEVMKDFRKYLVNIVLNGIIQTSQVRR